MNYKIRNEKNKKTISPVIATALLLVVAVVAVVGFSKWYNTYQSVIQVNTEQQSSNENFNTQIENLVGNTLYFKNKYQNLTIRKITLGGQDCQIAKNISIGISKFTLTNACLNKETEPLVDLVVYTNKGIFSKSFYLRDLEFNLNCSNLNGGKWIKVPGNSALGTSDFCVMKYEAKNEGGIATSEAANTPWVSISQISARTNCSALGTGYHLITNAEWTTIARNIEQVPSNWNSSIVGSGWIYYGHSDSDPDYALEASTNDSDGYYKITSTDPNQKRTLTLSNGEIIWDFAGNVWEFNNETCSIGDPWYDSSNAWVEWTNTNLVTERNLAGSTSSSYTSSNGIGQYYGCDLNGEAFWRGGRWGINDYSGIFAIRLSEKPTYTDIHVGFRCAYSQ